MEDALDPLVCTVRECAKQDPAGKLPTGFMKATLSAVGP